MSDSNSSRQKRKEKIREQAMHRFCESSHHLTLDAALTVCLSRMTVRQIDAATKELFNQQPKGK